MAYAKALVVFFFLVAFVSPCYSSEETITLTRDQYRRLMLSQNLFLMDRDSSLFLYSLGLLKSGNSQEVANFMDYQLDEIIVAAWKFKDELSEKQQEKIDKFLHDIKAYRQEHPRDPDAQVDPTLFSKYYIEFDKTYAERADKILESIE